MWVGLRCGVGRDWVEVGLDWVWIWGGLNLDWGFGCVWVGFWVGLGWAWIWAGLELG